MFVNFFYALRTEGIKVSLHEYLALLESFKMSPVGFSVHEFYGLAKSILIKSEHEIYRFNKVFEQFFQPLTSIELKDLFGQIPADWLKDVFNNCLLYTSDAADE